MKRKILIVDDEQDIRDVLAMALADMGHDVLTAGEGEQALRLFREASPPIVVTDIKMPGMDGIDLLQKLKQENPETEVIMITGHGDLDLAIRSLKCEATDFITKPINIDVLEIALRRAEERIVTRRQLREYTEHLEQLIREKSELREPPVVVGVDDRTPSPTASRGCSRDWTVGFIWWTPGFPRRTRRTLTEGWEAVKLTISRIRKMMLDILYYAKERELQTEGVDLARFAAQLATLFGKRMREQHIEFVSEVDPLAGEFEADPDVSAGGPGQHFRQRRGCLPER